MRTMEWIDGKLRMIDQRILPGREEWLLLETWEEVAHTIRDMAVRGAPAIGAAAAYGLALEAQAARNESPEDWWERMEDAAAGLRGTRPTAVNLAWAIDRVVGRVRAAGETTGSDLADRALVEAHAIAEEDVVANERLGVFGAELVPEGANILTHCNAGALATVAWGTALSVIYKAHDAGKQIHVWVDETRPLLQGARLTAWELHRAGVPMTLVADNAAGHLFQRGKVDMVVVGSDRVAANGDVVNKIGTYKVALLAQEHGVPFYAALPASTIDLCVPTGMDVPIEERGAEEVTTVGGHPVAPEGVRAANPAFDVTPNRLVAGIITEYGVVEPPFEEGLARVVARSRDEGVGT